MMRVLVTFTFLAGCASNAGGALSGQMPGGNFDIADTISAAVSISDGAGGTSNAAQIVLASTSHLCSDASAAPPIDRKGQRFLAIELHDVNGAITTTPAAPGTYTIYPDTGTEPPKSATLHAGGLDATCQSVDADDAMGQSGTVTLTGVTGGVFTGTFDVMLNTGGHITGSFDPEACPGLQAAASNHVHTCQ